MQLEHASPVLTWYRRDMTFHYAHAQSIVIQAPSNPSSNTTAKGVPQSNQQYNMNVRICYGREVAADSNLVILIKISSTQVSEYRFKQCCSAKGVHHRGAC